MKKYVTRIAIALLIGVIIIVISAVVILSIAPERAVFFSPDGKYKVITYTKPGIPIFAMPGQGSDRDGFARVYDLAGNLLCQVDVPMVGSVYSTDIRWRKKYVSIPSTNGFETCSLPE